MLVWTALLLGLIQGIAEFLPVSSSGHLALFEDFFLTLGSSTPLNVLLHCGTLLAVAIVFRRDLRALIPAYARLPRRLLAGGFFESADDDEILALLILIGTLPLVFVKAGDLIAEELCGSGLAAFVDAYIARRPVVVGALLILNGGMLLFSDSIASASAERPISECRPRHALLVGLFQMCALLPGISRSGATITACRLCGMPRSEALRFSFLLSVPAVLGSLVSELPKLLSQGSAGLPMTYCFAAFAVSLVVGALSLMLLRRRAESASFRPYSVYCFVVGTAAVCGGLLMILR